jgi:hypothetical protein
MSRKIEHAKPSIELIKKNLKILSLTVLLIVFSLLFLIVKSLYAILGYLPVHSVVIILATVAALVVADLYLAG